MNIDATIYLFLNEFAGKEFFLDFTFYFFASILPYLFIFFFLFLFLRNWKKYGWFVGEVLFTGFFARYALVELGRYFFPRVRPFQVLEEASLLLPYKESLSFPSGHTAFLFGISTAVYFYNKKAGVILYALSFIGGVSRVFMGIHWPLDIVAGALTGILGGIIISEIAKATKGSLTKK